MLTWRTGFGVLVLAGVVIVGCAGQGNSTLENSPTGARSSGGNRTSGEVGGTQSMRPIGQTSSVPNDADDPAIWIHPDDPAKSLILGNDKEEVVGGLYIWNLSGELVQEITPIDRPNNVDVEYGFELDGSTVDLVVVTERMKSLLRVFAIDRESGELSDVTGSTGFLGELEGEEKMPMGVGLYKRPSDGTVYAIVSPKAGPTEGYMAQYRLVANGDKVDTKLVRRFGQFSGLVPDDEGEMEGEIEAVVVDDELGFVYYSDELAGIRKYYADPDAENAGKELAYFGREGYQGDREGLALVARPDGEGYLVSVDQIEGGSILNVLQSESV